MSTFERLSRQILEIMAIMLASDVNKILCLNQVSYFTDCKLLASSLQSEDPVTQAKDWRIRPLLADFLRHSQGTSYTINKIPRQRNSTAHSLAAQARSQADIPACLFACQNGVGNCDLRMALQSICRLTSVTCIG
ncbi:unnamed protein product [Urochloa humidicola]